MAIAAARERAPERHKKNSGAPGLNELRFSASITCCTNSGLGADGKNCHSHNKVCLPSGDRSGTPTKFHSALVRTSTSCAERSCDNLFQLSSGERSPAYLSAEEPIPVRF